MGVACSTHGGGVYRFLVGKPEGRRPLGTLRLRWDDNIKMKFPAVGWVGMGWIDLALVRRRWRAVVKRGDEPSGYIKWNYLNRWGTGRFSGRTLLREVTKGIMRSVNTTNILSGKIYLSRTTWFGNRHHQVQFAQLKLDKGGMVARWWDLIIYYHDWIIYLIVCLSSG
jgi:hypothetical protein